MPYILNQLYCSWPRFSPDLSKPLHWAKIGVSAVKIKNYLFILFIFKYFKIITALKLESVTSQEIKKEQTIATTEDLEYGKDRPIKNKLIFKVSNSIWIQSLSKPPHLINRIIDIFICETLLEIGCCDIGINKSQIPLIFPENHDGFTTSLDNASNPWNLRNNQAISLWLFYPEKSRQIKPVERVIKNLGYLFGYLSLSITCNILINCLLQTRFRTHSLRLRSPKSDAKRTKASFSMPVKNYSFYGTASFGGRSPQWILEVFSENCICRNTISRARSLSER